MARQVPASRSEVLLLLRESGELHLHRVVATKKGYTRWFLVTVLGSRICGTDRCLRVPFSESEKKGEP